MNREVKKEISKSTLGLGLVLIAFCCGPVLLLLLGVSGFGGIVGILAGFLTRNIYFIVLGLILLGAFGWIIYRHK